MQCISRGLSNIPRTFKKAVDRCSEKSAIITAVAGGIIFILGTSFLMDILPMALPGSTGTRVMMAIGATILVTGIALLFYARRNKSEDIEMKDVASSPFENEPV